MNVIIAIVGPLIVVLKTELIVGKLKLATAEEGTCPELSSTF
jgi:hypothetical protein